MKKALTIMLLGLGILACSKEGTSKNETTGKTEEKKKVGITQFIEHPALDASKEGFIKALSDNGYIDGQNIEIDFQNSQGDQNIAQTIAQEFVTEKKDLILAIATPSAQATYNITKDIPILITAVTDPIEAGLVKSLEKPETNVTGTSDATPIDKQFKLLKELLPASKKVGIVYNTSELNSEVQVAQAKVIAEKYGLEIVTKGVTQVNELAQALDSLLPNVDVLYTPTDNLVVSATPLVVKKALDNKKPVIGCIEDQVNQGALATETIDYYKLGYQTGEVAVKILKGEKPNNIPVKTLENTDLMINKKTAASLGITIPEEILKGAKKVIE